MIDIKDLMANPNKYREAMASRGLDPNKIEELMSLYSRVRETRYLAEQERKRKNEISKRYKIKEV